MWVAKFRGLNKDKENKIIMLIKKYSLKMFYYPVNYYTDKNNYYFIAVGIVQGEEKNKKKFFSEFKKLKKAKKGRRVKLLEVEGDFFVAITYHTKDEEMERYINIFYDPSIIHFNPVVVYSNGWEEWEVASASRKNIERMIEIGKKLYNLKLLKIGWRKIKNFGFMTILPKLTDKQRKALELAIQHGYYEYPRRISLDKLSKIAKLSFSTLQAHIRKAENKIISFVINLKK